MAWDQKCCRAHYQSSPASPGLWCVAYISSMQNIAGGYQYDSGVTQQRWRLRRLWVIAAIMFQVFSRYFLIHCCVTRLTEHGACLLLRQVLRVNSVHAVQRIASVKQLQCGNPFFSHQTCEFSARPPLSRRRGNTCEVTLRFWCNGLFLNRFCIGTSRTFCSWRNSLRS